MLLLYKNDVKSRFFLDRQTSMLYNSDIKLISYLTIKEVNHMPESRKERNMADLGKLFQEAEPYIIEMRRWFHEHPEVSLKEEKTSEKIKEELAAMGIPYEELKPSYGVVATIQGKDSGKVIGARADIDALPVTEDTGLEFTSCNVGEMHACGHDAHIAMLLGVAKVMNQIKDELNGTVKLVFQAAEEIGEGYQEVLNYFHEKGGVDRMIGLHIWSTLPQGEMLLIPGSVFAGATAFKCEINGQGGHGARPDLVKDPIKAACDLVLKLAAIPSNFYDVLDHSVVSVGQIHSGTQRNIFPSYAEVEGTTRFYKAEGEMAIKGIMKQIADGVGATYGVDIEVSHSGEIPPVYNTPDYIPHARELVNEVEGLTLSPQTDPICAGDNFGMILREYPGFYGILGAGKAGEYNYPQHHAKFDIQETEFRKGAEFMGRYIADYLK